MPHQVPGSGPLRHYYVQCQGVACSFPSHAIVKAALGTAPADGGVIGACRGQSPEWNCSTAGAVPFSA
ncbi:hypothetical protein V2G26_017153 [Clonostachys chloroleuca]